MRVFFVFFKSPDGGGEGDHSDGSEDESDIPSKKIDREFCPGYLLKQLVGSCSGFESVFAPADVSGNLSKLLRQNGSDRRLGSPPLPTLPGLDPVSRLLHFVTALVHL